MSSNNDNDESSAVRDGADNNAIAESNNHNNTTHDENCALPTFNPNDDTVIKNITRQLFDAEKRVTREEAIDFNYRCNLGVNIRSGRNDGGEDTLRNIIKTVRSTFDGHLKGMIEETIKQECVKKGIRYKGQPITKMSQLADAWAADQTLAEKVWHCAFGVFFRQMDWENEFEVKAMEQLKYRYIEDDDNDEGQGTQRRGNKGCVAKLATKVKREVVKCINRKTGKTHGIKVIAGTDPEILGTYANGKAKYKKRTSATDSFNFDPTLHTTQTHKKQVSAHFAKIIGKHSTSYLASLRPSSLTKKQKSNPNQNTPKQVTAPRQPKKSSPKKTPPKKATTPRQTKKSSPTRKTPKRATAKNTTTTETVPPTQLLCYLGGRCLSTTNKITFMHRCSGCQAAMHVICGEVDENDSSWCFTCIDKNKEKFDGKLISNNRAKLMGNSANDYNNHQLATAANSGDEPGTTQQLAEGTGDAATLTVIQKMQQEILALRQEKEDNAKKILSMAQGAAQHIDKVRKEKTKDNKEKGRNETAKVPKGKQKAPTTEQQDDNTTIEDSNIDYTIEKNYSVKRFIGHTIKMRGEKGPPIIQLQATWKGYEGGETTLEPWGKMKKHHSRQLKRYVNRNPDLKEVTETYQLFNKLAVGGKSNYNQG